MLSQLIFGIIYRGNLRHVYISSDLITPLKHLYFCLCLSKPTFYIFIYFWDGAY